MKIVFRVDASAQMGSGHLMRCLTLAEALRARGAKTYFICREQPGNLIGTLQEKAIPVAVLPAPPMFDGTPGEDYAAWLGVPQREDAKQTLDVLKSEKPDWLVVDHYGLDDEWEQRLRPYVNKMMVIDDLANRRHDCDVLLDQNDSTQEALRYAGRVSDICKLLIGPRYALLQPEYVAYRRTLLPRNGKVRRALLFFGGTDRRNMTGMALAALSVPELCHLAVDVVIGANNPHREELLQQAGKRSNAVIHYFRPYLADLMAQTDLAIGAGGVTTWERMCLGLPTVLVTIAENQRPGAAVLAAKQLVLYAGHASEISIESLSKVVIALVSDANRLIEMTTQSQLMVDGLGAMRTREVILPTDTAQICLRPARQEDVVIYFNWVNDPEVRKNAIQTDTISWETHQEWFAKKLNDPRSHLFVLEAAGLPVGQIRFDREGDEARIDYSLDPLVRGRGWGVRLLSLGIKLLHEIDPIPLRAEVKEGNRASRSVLLRLGFTITESSDDYCVFYLSSKSTVKPFNESSLRERKDVR